MRWTGAAARLLRAPGKLPEVEDNLRSWRSAYAARATSLDGMLPTLRLAAEALRAEVEAAPGEVCGMESFQDFLYQQTLRRRDSLRNRRANLKTTETTN